MKLKLLAVSALLFQINFVFTQVSVVNANLNELVGIMKAKEQPESTEESVTLTKSQFKKLEAELAAGK